MSVEFGIYPLTGILLAGLLYGIYWLLIRMRCHPRTSQWYIVASVVVSLIVTFMQPVRYVTPDAEWMSGNATESSPTLTSQNGNALNETNQVPIITHSAPKHEESPTTKPLLDTNVFIGEAVPVLKTIYLVGLAAMLIFFLLQMAWMVRIRKRSTHMEMENGVRVYDTDISVPFSYGNSIFMPKEMERLVRDDVFLHESKHLSHHHYLKLCLMQLFQSVGWFNPFIWIFAKECKMQQEMEVDQDVVKSGRNRELYQMNLLKMCLKSNSWVQIMPAFGSSLIKRRILFMNQWKPSKNATARMSVSFVLLVLLLTGTAFVTFDTKLGKRPIDGCWTIEWIKNSDSPYEVTPFLTNNHYWGNGMEMNFSWYSRFNGVNMNFNFSGTPVTYLNDKYYDDKGDEMDITMPDADTYLYRWTRTPEMTAMASGSDITEKWKRTEPDKGVLRIIKSFREAQKDKSRLLCGVWREVPDTVEYQENYLTVSNGIYGRFTIYSNPKSYWCSAGGWCGEIFFRNDEKVYVGDRFEDIEWHTRDSMTLIIPRDSGVVEHHVYRRSKLPERFLRCLTATED